MIALHPLFVSRRFWLASVSLGSWWEVGRWNPNTGLGLFRRRRVSRVAQNTQRLANKTYRLVMPAGVLGLCGNERLWLEFG